MGLVAGIFACTQLAPRVITLQATGTTVALLLVSLLGEWLRDIERESRLGFAAVPENVPGRQYTPQSVCVGLHRLVSSHFYIL